jgi:dihydrofolate synthase/folylpolyglutamate synthase
VTYREAVAWLYGLQLHGIKLGLENMRRLCSALELSLNGESGPSFIHVAGTNGKGSVCAMLDAICREAGLRTGLYTSPHLVTFRERIRLNGAMISEEAVAAGLTRIRELTAGWDHPPTFFEVTTALALAWFQEQTAEAVVLETGLGGRLDATNVVTPSVSVITPIGYDHQQYLGKTLDQITGEKAGIIKPGVPVVSAPQSPEAAAVIERTSSETGSPLSRVSESIERSAIGLLGSHQGWNAAVAQAAISAAAKTSPWDRIEPEHVTQGLAHVRWPGRFQRAGEHFILDGAHNPAAAAALVETWREVFPNEKATIILGVMRDKEVSAVCAALAPIAHRVLAVTVGNPRSCTATELAEVVRTQLPGTPCEEFPSLGVALKQLVPGSGRVLICGSLFLVGEALHALGLAEAPPESSLQ